VPLEETDPFKNALRKYRVPVSRFETIRRELRLMGITQATIFPDLLGLCADIQVEYIDSWQTPSSI
jgi:hypothetical protein